MRERQSSRGGGRPFVAEETASLGKLTVGRLCCVQISGRQPVTRARQWWGEVIGKEMVVEKQPEEDCRMNVLL